MLKQTKKFIFLGIKSFITCILSNASEINIAAAASTTIMKRVDPTVIFSPTPYKKAKNNGTEHSDQWLKISKFMPCRVQR